MEDAGAQVASPIFIHQSVAGRFVEPHSMAKKRSLPFLGANFGHQQSHPNNWNHNAFNWDSRRFVAKPSEFNSVNRLNAMDVAVQLDQSVAPNSSRSNHMGEEEILRLQLGGGGANIGITANAELVSRPSKRVRSGSPGGMNYPMCQVDDCTEDLSRAKDYHRRHKVCEVHSKATKALVGNEMQRFCQQCSRFHPLLEFDEGKRSCRRRLAGHNRRRRKTQPEDSAAHVVLAGNQENTDKNDMDIVNLLAVLARAQGNADDIGVLPSAVADKEQLLQILKKLHSLPLPANITEKIQNLGSSGNTASFQSSSPAQNRGNGNTSLPSTKNLLAALSVTPMTPSTDVLEFQSEGSSQGSDSGKSKSASLGRSPCLDLQDGLRVQRPVAGERSSSSDQSPVEESDCHVQEAHPDLTLQLFSSSPEIDSIPKLAADRKYFSSGSSNPSIERSPSSSPPVAQKLFPVPCIRKKGRPGTIPVRPVAANVSATKAAGNILPLQLFGGSSTGADNGSSQNSPDQAGYTSSSGSDHSPSSLISDAQDRTGRILFKLFDKDPSHLPGSLRAQVYNWLSSSPSEMESYIRPGCIVLSIYVSMPSSAWDQLEGNLYLCIKSLVEHIDSDFWRNGRFLVHTLKQLASYQEGKIRLCKSWKRWSSPELVSVLPVAVVSGQESSVVLRGRNLTIPGTKISCTHMASYTIEQVRVPTSQLISDEICLDGFKIDGANDKSLGRCFIEVENGVSGSSFPLIIANAAICRELGLLEFEFKEGVEVHDETLASHVPDSWVSTSREEALHFLNELGWLFQRKNNSSLLEAPAYKISRFKFLFVFSVEHDFCALVRTLLDILLEINLVQKELTKESLEMLHEIHLLNRAVKRRCMNMVNLLLHYSVFESSDNSSKYVFPPNASAPGGISPLHVAASMSNSDNLVDALTNDPQETGMQCWNSTLDSNGFSPYAYALMRNNNAYNDLVARKLADKENGQMSLLIRNEAVSLELEKEQNNMKQSEFKQVLNSCSRCAIAATRSSRSVSGTQGLLQRPFIHSMLAIAAVCVCVCLLFRGAPDIGSVAPFKWEKLEFGAS